MTEQIAQTRLIFRQRIGEIIEATIGRPDIKRVFEAAEQGDDAAQERIAAAQSSGFAPSGQIATQSGAVDKTTKDALLTAQAAERTLLSLEALAHFYAADVPAMQRRLHDEPRDASLAALMHSPRTETIETYYKEHVAVANTRDPSFKFIGSAGDAETLVTAQAVYQLMTEYERNEKSAVKDEMIGQYMRIPDAVAFGEKYMDGFKACARQSYAIAAAVMAAQGYASLAADMTAVAESIGYDADNARRHTPAGFVTALDWQENRLALDVNIMLDPCAVRPDHPYATVSQDWLGTLHTRGQQAMRCGL